jgi:hypothetical protein
MIAFLSQLIPWEWIAGAAVVVAGMVSMWFGGRKSAKSDIKIKSLRATAEKADAGRKGEAQAKADLRNGKTPEEIVRANDGAWK